MDRYNHLRTARIVLSDVARRLRILQCLDWISYCVVRVSSIRRCRDFIERNPDFPVPPPHLAYDAYNTISWDDYFTSGHKSAEIISELMTRHLAVNNARVLEWGCGPARIIRHLPELLGSGVAIYGSDYNAESISWCRKHIKGVTFVENQLAPPLCFEEGFFDCVYGASVLTHLSEEMCKAWIKELGRITRKGRIIILTTKGEIQVARLLPRERRKIINNEPVFRGNIVEGKKMFDTILPAKYIKSVLFAGFELVEHIPAKESSSHHNQDLWVIRNP